MDTGFFKSRIINDLEHSNDHTTSMVFVNISGFYVGTFYRLCGTPKILGSLAKFPNKAGKKPLREKGGDHPPIGRCFVGRYEQPGPSGFLEIESV
jgi:hypothetical protein